MKYLVFSDLHGSIESLKKVIEKFHEKKCDTLLCLGDVLYHGPRNDIPSNYKPKEVIELLNKYKDKIICVKGNCDALVDEMVLDFKLHDEYNLKHEKKKILMTHGHVISPYSIFDLSDTNIVLYGHYHVYNKHTFNNITYLNPGSVTIPKQNQAKSYAILDGLTFNVYDFEDNLLLNVNL